MVQTETGTSDQAAQPQAPRQRAQSETEFPYADLEAAADLARAIHTNAGTSGEDEEVAAWLDMSANGGTFRARRSSARMFGLIDVSQGRLSLTDLGRRIVNDADSRAARVEAFLKPELFSQMYDQFRGQVLPPPAAIERHMEQQLGVPPKQKSRARQVFQKSAQYASYIDATSGRFVKPGIAGDPERGKKDAEGTQRDGGGSGPGDGGGKQPPVDPIIAGLLARLPKSGDVWPEVERKLWLELLAGSFKLIYKDKPEPVTPDSGHAP